MNKFEKFKRYIRAVPKRKHYLEFFVAMLSIPVLLTAILINLANLRSDDTKKNTEPQSIIISYAPGRSDEGKSDTTKPTGAECKKTVGPINISYPDEGDIVTNNPLEVTIDYDRTGEYCAIVWSYRINGGRWSDFDDKSLALYNLPNGQKTFELRIKSVAGGGEKILKRTFDYQGTETQPTVAPTQPQTTPTQ
jgi:hypothetical protein